MKILIKNGIVVTAENEMKADVLIDGEIITAIGASIDITADRIIDAAGKYVMPGGIDQHTHFDALQTTGDKTNAPYDTTKAVVVGGTTTIVDYAPQDPGKGLVDSIHYRINVRAKDKTYVDFALHALITEVKEDIFDEIKELPEYGVPTIKCFMAYKGSALYVDDGTLYRVMKASKENGVTVFVHAESADLTDMFRNKAIAEGKTAPRYHIETRPPVVETEATKRAIFLAEETGCPLYVVHVTTKGARDAIREAQGRRSKIYGETCTHYLTVTKDKLYVDDFEEAAKYVCSPALRDQDDVNAMWEAVQDGTFSAIVSDHCGIDMETKRLGKDDFTKIANGAPGAADRIPVIWTTGVVTGKISRQKFVDLCATSPAKINGIYPRKGTIAVGSDADIMIFDPDYKGIIRWEDNPNGVEYNVYEGMELQGRPDIVILRGNVLVEDGKYIGPESLGEFIPGKAFGPCYEGL